MGHLKMNATVIPFPPATDSAAELQEWADAAIESGISKPKVSAIVRDYIARAPARILNYGGSVQKLCAAAAENARTVGELNAAHDIASIDRRLGYVPLRGSVVAELRAIAERGMK
jgi:hypothetical protein